MHTVTLKKYEIEMAAWVGIRRNQSSIEKNLRHTAGFNGDSERINIDGALGEIAVAKALGIYWDGSVDTWKADDLRGMQVRATTHESGRLIIRQNDDDSSRFVLVVGRCPTFRVVGWIVAADAKRREYWGSLDPTREPSWNIPQSKLRPMAELITELTAV